MDLRTLSPRALAQLLKITARAMEAELPAVALLILGAIPGILDEVLAGILAIVLLGGVRLLQRAVKNDSRYIGDTLEQARVDQTLSEEEVRAALKALNQITLPGRSTSDR